MEELLLRRRTMMNTDYPEPYISDGLVFHLDGICKGSDSNRWTSLVGNAYFTLNSSISTVENNAVVVNGTGPLSGSNAMVIPATTGTIELCGQILTPVTTGFLFSSNNGSSNKPLSVVKYSNGFMYSYARFTNNCYNFDNFDTIIASPFSVSMNGLTGLLNGVSYTSMTSNGYNNTPFYIGAKSNASYATNARIFSIRMYNRQLSQSEMLHNLAVDNKRFSLGLNL